MNTSTTQKTVHQSKWGFHPCDWETSQKLKRLSKAYQQGLRQQAAWNRWSAKLPHNRVIRRWKRNEQGQRIGYEIVGPAPEPKLNRLMTYLNQNRASYSISGQWGALYPIDITAEYRKARTPAPTPEAVRPLLLTPDQINTLIGELGD